MITAETSAISARPRPSTRLAGISSGSRARPAANVIE
jgi:hypothetical protein